MSDSSDQGSGAGAIRADISDDVIQEALRSVERHNVKAVEAPSASAEEVAKLQSEVTSLTAQVELSQAKGRELMDKVKESHERMLRAAADLDNYKRRAVKEKEEVQKFGTERLLRDFLPVIDNLDRALEHAQAGIDQDGFRAGVAMTRKLFEDTLTKHGVKPFTAKGLPFDPHLHEAMGQAETDEMPPNHVAQELLRGYLLNDRLVRPALVMVSRAPVAQAPVEAAPVDAAPVDAAPVDAAPVDAAPVETEAVEAKPVSAEPGEPVEAAATEASLPDEQDP